MDILYLGAGLLLGAAGAALAVFFAQKSKHARLESDLENSRRSAEEKIALLEKAGRDLRESFQALSSEALKSNNRSFLDLAKATLEKYQAEAKGDLEQKRQAVEQLVGPLKESLSKVESHNQAIEKARIESYGALREQVSSLSLTQQKLQGETANLVKALRSPQTRGRWGEVQLRRVVELAGMTDHCDFDEQRTVHTEDGRMRPDMIVKLPGGKTIVVDAKAPLLAYLEALEAPSDEQRLVKLKEHMQQVRAHIAALSAKTYWDQFDQTPELVVLFLPGEAFFSAALEQDPTLIDYGAQKNVILGSPTNLIAILKAVYYGWRQEKIAESARKTGDLGRELHERIATLVEHFGKVGSALGKSVEAYNQAVGSLETRVLTSARKFQELGAGSKKEIAEIEAVENAPRLPQEGE